MNELKEILSVTSEVESQGHFEKIASELMRNYIICKGNKKYRIVEIEFYRFSSDNPDVITYPRDMKAGRWFFHQSGVDITFESKGIEEKGKAFDVKSDACFGGILLRGLCELDSAKSNVAKSDMTGRTEGYIFGPVRCVNELWDDFDAFSPSCNPSEYPVIRRCGEGEKWNESEMSLMKCKRHINIKDARIQTKRIKEWAKRLNFEMDDDEVEEYRKNLFDDVDKYLYRFFYLEKDVDPRTFSCIPSVNRPNTVFDVKS